jgi:phosphate transport system protein
MSEQRQEFDRQLEDIEAKVIELFAMVAEDLPKATEALLTGDSQTVTLLAERESAIDALYPEIEVVASRAILLQAPVAADLRFLLTVLRIVPEIERSHDLVMQIATQGSHMLNAELTPRVDGLIRRMDEVVSGMWRQAADAWYQRDRSVALALAEIDEDLDGLYASLLAELASGRLPLPVTMEITLAGHDYERLGAHAVNIARRVMYLAGTKPPETTTG